MHLNERDLTLAFDNRTRQAVGEKAPGAAVIARRGSLDSVLHTSSTKRRRKAVADQL
jgi:hypothetical protein